MSMYAPILRREVFLVCFDRRHRVALVSVGLAVEPGSMTLPMVRKGERESYKAAAGRISVGRIPAAALRPANLVGRVEASLPIPAGRGRRREARIFMAHLDREAPQFPSGGCGESILWVAHTEVAQAVASLGIPDLDALIEGYVDGWIPDGWITLGP